MQKCSIKRLFQKLGIVTCQDADLGSATLSVSEIGVLLLNLGNFSEQLHAEQLIMASFGKLTFLK